MTERDRQVRFTEECVSCGICADQICTIRYMEDGKLKVRDADCTGCGSCTVSCRVGAITLVKVG